MKAAAPWRFSGRRRSARTRRTSCSFWATTSAGAICRTTAGPRTRRGSRVDAARGTIVMQDGHSGGTVCSPTRASVLTGRNHFRDCVDYVYGCSDMTECVPAFPFAQQRTFTFADAVRASGRGYRSWFGGKWHLGSFYNDSEAYGGVTSSPLFHGFERMNATVEVAPTATANWQCDAGWNASGVEFGHYGKPNHCAGGANPGGPGLPDGCCFNYWTEDATAPHGVTNLTAPSDADDSAYVASAFLDGFLGALAPEEPFAAQLSFHNCHIPFIGQPASRAACAASDACAAATGAARRAPTSRTRSSTSRVLSELDAAVGAVLDRLDALGLTRTRSSGSRRTTARGELRAAGFCGDGHYAAAPGDGPAARPSATCGRAATACRRSSRGHGRRRRRRARELGLVVPAGFLATAGTLGVDRPAAQRDWAFDGRSVLPILRGGAGPTRARSAGRATTGRTTRGTATATARAAGSWSSARRLVRPTAACRALRPRERPRRDGDLAAARPDGSRRCSPTSPPGPTRSRARARSSRCARERQSARARRARAAALARARRVALAKIPGFLSTNWQLARRALRRSPYRESAAARRARSPRPVSFVKPGRGERAPARATPRSRRSAHTGVFAAHYSRSLLRSGRRLVLARRPSRGGPRGHLPGRVQRCLQASATAGASSVAQAAAAGLGARVRLADRALEQLRVLEQVAIRVVRRRAADDDRVPVVGVGRLGRGGASRRCAGSARRDDGVAVAPAVVAHAARRPR